MWAITRKDYDLALIFGCTITTPSSWRRTVYRLRSQDLRVWTCGSRNNSFDGDNMNVANLVVFLMIVVRCPAIEAEVKTVDGDAAPMVKKVEVYSLKSAQV
jgi:hypothetical protein